MAIYATLLGAPSAAGQKEPAPLSAEQQAVVRDTARQLARDVDRLTEAIAAAADGKQAKLFGQADALLSDLAAFEQAIKPDATRKDLYGRFGQLDGKLHALFTAAQAAAKEDRAVQRALVYAQASDDELHFVLSAGDASEAQLQEVLKRQARAFGLAAETLDRLAKVALADSPNRTALETTLHKLAAAAGEFQSTAAQAKDRVKQRDAFRSVNQAWEQAVAGLKTLPPRDSVFLLRTATRVDQLHERIYRLLEVPGERPRLIIRS